MARMAAAGDVTANEIPDPLAFLALASWHDKVHFDAQQDIYKASQPGLGARLVQPGAALIAEFFSRDQLV